MRPDLPTGVVTLLFTDIEGSTRLLTDLRADHVEALEGHRQTLQSVFAQYDGVVVDSQGDAMLMACARPGDATRAAGAASRSARMSARSGPRRPPSRTSSMKRSSGPSW